MHLSNTQITDTSLQNYYQRVLAFNLWGLSGVTLVSLYKNAFFFPDWILQFLCIDLKFKNIIRIYLNTDPLSKPCLISMASFNL